MNTIYFAALLALVLTAFILGRNRAVELASARKGKGVLHSLPVYHGLLAAASVFTAMVVVYASARPSPSGSPARAPLRCFRRHHGRQPEARRRSA